MSQGISQTDLSSKNKESYEEDSLNLDKWDNFSFRPITDGLGFHQGNLEDSFPKWTNKRNDSFQPHKPSTSHVGRTKYIEQTVGTATSVPIESISPMSLAPFYQGPTQAEAPLNLKGLNEVKRESMVEANFQEKILAWMLDFACIGLIMVVNFGAFFILSTIFVEDAKAPFNVPGFSEIILSFSNWSFFFVIFASYYILYFSLLDAVTEGSIGKAALGIGLVNGHGGAVRLRDSVLRSIVVLFSLPFLGLPLLKSPQNTLTNTKVIKKLKVK